MASAHAFRRPTIQGSSCPRNGPHHGPQSSRGRGGLCPCCRTGRNEYLVPVAFDFLEELYAGNLWHWRLPAYPPTVVTNKQAQSKIGWTHVRSVLTRPSRA